MVLFFAKSFDGNTIEVITSLLANSITLDSFPGKESRENITQDQMDKVIGLRKN